MKFTHGPTTLPGSHPFNDRTVYCDGYAIGRVLRIEHGALQGQWQWSCLWIGGGHGVAETRIDAVEAISNLAPVDVIALLPSGYRSA
ncbi:MAG: hypothetical protein AAGC70_16900 [Pseudomonadota bacterium]